MVKNLPAKQETWVQSLGQEDPLEEEMATYSSMPAGKIHEQRGGWQAIVHGVIKGSDTTQHLHHHHQYTHTNTHAPSPPPLLHPILLFSMKKNHGNNINPYYV